MDIKLLLNIIFTLGFTLMMIWAFVILPMDADTDRTVRIVFVPIAYLVLCIGSILLFIIWNNTNHDKVIASEDIYRLDYKTGDWLNIESNAIVDTDKIRWEEIVAELDPGDAPIIRKITYGNESLHGTRYVKVIGKDNGIIKMEGGGSWN